MLTKYNLLTIVGRYTALIFSEKWIQNNVNLELKCTIFIVRFCISYFIYYYAVNTKTIIIIVVNVNFINIECRLKTYFLFSVLQYAEPFKALEKFNLGNHITYNLFWTEFHFVKINPATILMEKFNALR